VLRSLTTVICLDDCVPAQQTHHDVEDAISCLCLQTLDSQLAGEQGSKLDVYEMEVANERGDALQDLAEFNLAVVSGIVKLTGV
jgi:hypothetical protein